MNANRLFGIACGALLLGVSGFGFAGAAAEPEDEGSSASMATGRYNEAPMLAALVAAGELPPVDERLPENPSVLQPIEEIGRYGGTLRVFAVDPNPWNDLTESVERGGGLAKVAPDGSVVGDLAESFSTSPDKRTFTITLRAGTKWSDGAPFTVDDIIFMFEDLVWHEEVSTWNEYKSVYRLTKVDDRTVHLESEDPTPGLELKLITWQGGDWLLYQPKHYLQKWHIEHNPDANAIAKEEGFDNWAEALHAHFWWTPTLDKDKPTLHAWRFAELNPTTRIWERNPYYWKVDTANNQLPYVDRVVSTVVEQDVYTLKIISGEADVAFVRTSLDDFALYKENEDQGGYRVVLLPGLNGSDIGISLNLNHPEQWRAELYQDLRFRQAVSMAINRDEVNEAAFFGLAVPRQTTTLPQNSYYKDEWENVAADYDPDTANELLDELGLTEKDRFGIRIAPNGEPLQIVIEFPVPRISTEAMELVKEYWEAVGVKVLLKPESNFGQRRQLNKHDARVDRANNEEVTEFAMGAEYHTCYRSRGIGETAQWVPCGSNHAWGHNWGRWLAADAALTAGTHTLADFEGGEMPGEEPPEDVKMLDQWGQEWVKTEYGSPEYIELAQKIFDFQARNLVIIGVVGLKPVPLIAKRNIGNIPTGFTMGMEGSTGLNVHGDQFFFKN